MVDQYKYQHSHLLQLIYEANKDGLIDQSEKIKIKEMIINNNSEIDNLYEQYEKSKDSVKFIQSLKALSNGTLGSNDEDPNLNNVISSPEDSRLVNRKKAKAKKNETVKSPEIFGESVQNCEVGNSPKISLHRRNFDDEEEESD